MADIIVTDVTPRIQYTAGAGSPTVFSYPFPIFEDTDLNVYLTPVGVDPDDVTQILVYNVDYTVTNSSPPTVGGTITLTTGATSGDVITIVRNQPDDRLNNYIAGGLFEATDVNTDFDRTVFMSQQNKMYDQAVGVHYNLSAQPVAVTDTVLPVLGANEVWVKNNANTAITTYNIAGGGSGGVVNSVTGTANRITATPTTGDVIVNISASYVGQASITTLGTISTGTWNGTTIGTAYGGTGLTTVTNSAALISSSTGVPAWSSTMTDGQLIIGSTGSIPVAASLTAGSGVSITPGAGTITISATGSGGTVTSVSGTANRITSTGGTTPVIDISASYVGQSSITTLGTIATGVWNGTAVGTSYGGTGLTTTNNSASLVTNSSGVPSYTSSMTNGQIVIGSTGGTPAPATLTAGSNITITNAANSITIAASSGGGGGWTLLLAQTASSSAQLEFNGYFTSTYDEYIFEFVNVLPATDAAFLTAQLGTGGGPTYVTTGYTWNTNGVVSTSTANYSATSGAGTYIPVSINNTTYGPSNVGGGVVGYMRLGGTNGSSNIAVTNGIVGYVYTGNTTSAVVANTSRLGAAVYTSIKFYESSGNIASGSIRMYGVQKS